MQSIIKEYLSTRKKQRNRDREGLCLFWHSNYVSMPYFPIWNAIPSKPNDLHCCADQQKKNQRYLEMKQKLTKFFFANSFQMQLIATYYIGIGLLKLSKARKFSICMDGWRTQTYMPPQCRTRVPTQCWSKVRDDTAWVVLSVPV